MTADIVRQSAVDSLRSHPIRLPTGKASPAAGLASHSLEGLPA